MGKKFRDGGSYSQASGQGRLGREDLQHGPLQVRRDHPLICMLLKTATGGNNGRGTQQAAFPPNPAENIVFLLTMSLYVFQQFFNYSAILS